MFYGINNIEINFNLFITSPTQTNWNQVGLEPMSLTVTVSMSALTSRPPGPFCLSALATKELLLAYWLYCHMMSTIKH